jgi:hypothetical protein
MISNELILNINLYMVNDIPLNSNMKIYYCKDCNFYYSDANNTQDDYNNYYSKFNNYKNYNISINKDDQCANYIKNFCQNKNIRSIIDYGSGNGTISNLLSDSFLVDLFDIGMSPPTKKYDFLLLSHVLEHIYDINTFINNISQYITENGYLYIEVPNAEYYNEITDICPLQEINIEHINFFSKYALNKLLLNHGYYCVSIEDDYFLLNSSKYYVIRGIFKKNVVNTSFLNYIENGKKSIEKYQFNKLNQYSKIYLYGCGQFLFKIFDNIIKNTNIVNIIDDNSSYKNKQIDTIFIIPFEEYVQKIQSFDVILITTIINSDRIKNKLLSLDIHPVILDMHDLY